MFETGGEYLAYRNEGFDCWDTRIKFLDIKSEKIIKTLSGENKEICSIAISPNSKYASALYSSNTFYIWDIEKEEKIWSFYDKKILSCEPNCFDISSNYLIYLDYKKKCFEIY